MTIIHKDAGIVMDEAKLAAFHAPLSAVAEQVFTAALSAGLGKEDDGNVVMLWERMGGRSVAEQGSAQEAEEEAQKPGGEEAIKTVAELLNGVYIVAAAEALAFARRKGMDLDDVFKVVGTSAATSKPLVQFKDELSWPEKHSPAPDQPSVATTLARLNAVLGEGKRVNTPLFLTQAAQQVFTVAASKGWEHEGASIIGKLWS